MIQEYSQSKVIYVVIRRPEACEALNELLPTDMSGYLSQLYKIQRRGNSVEFRNRSVKQRDVKPYIVLGNLQTLSVDINERAARVLSQKWVLRMYERLQVILMNPWAEKRREEVERRGQGENDCINGLLWGTWCWKCMPSSPGF